MERPCPSDRLSIGSQSPELGQLGVQSRQALFELLDREHIAVEGRLTDRIVEAQLLEPCPMPCSPMMLGLPVDAVASQQELGEPVPRTHQVHAHVVAAAAQINGATTSQITPPVSSIRWSA